MSKTSRAEREKARALKDHDARASLLLFAFVMSPLCAPFIAAYLQKIQKERPDDCHNDPLFMAIAWAKARQDLMFDAQKKVVGPKLFVPKEDRIVKG